VPPSGGWSITISVREPGMPMTVSRNSLDEHPVLDLHAQRNEERRHGVEVCDGDVDVVEVAYV
jgi:hypothetical protein